MTTGPGGASPQPMEMGRVNLGAKPVEEYLRAVGDELPIYRESGLAPPLYATASSLALLLKALELPPGAIHSLQEVDTLSPIRIGHDLRAVAALERPRQRAGLTFITATCTLETESNDEAMNAKSTVMVDDAGNSPPGRESDQRNGSVSPSELPSELPVVTRTITQEQLVAYSAASGDDNPLHLDTSFAAGTRFGGIIAHGMLTLAFVSEMMAAHLGLRWLTGRLPSGQVQGRSSPRRQGGSLGPHC